MRKLFMTDIHGEYDGMMRLLERARFEPGADRLVVGGDIVSRGPDSGRALQAVRRLTLQHPQHVVALTGNHEEMMTAYFRGGSDMWLKHAGNRTLPSLKKRFADADEWAAHLDWAASLPLLYEDEQFVYAHAGIDPYVSLEDQPRDMIWMAESDFYGYPKEKILERTGGRTVVHGHTPCEFIYSDGARMNCDLGAHTYSVREEQALGLVDLTNAVYYVYKLHTKTITERKLSILA